MIREERLSTSTIIGGWLNPPVSRPIRSLHWGPVALNDADQGLLVKVWEIWIEDETSVMIKSAGHSASELFSRGSKIEEVSLAFDFNGAPMVAFVEETGAAFLWWFDPVAIDYVFYALDSGVVNPRITLDDARVSSSSSSDVLLCYVRDDALYYRQQRDRFLTERHLRDNVTKLHHVSMNSQLRVQFKAEGVGGDGPPILADVVRDLCERAGIPSENINVDELYEDTVPGMKVDVDEGLDQPIDWLREIYFFDKADYDRQIHFPKRGRPVVARIPYVHLVEGNPQALKQVIKDEKKLPRLVNVNHLDPDAGHAKNKQTAERRSNVVVTDVSKTIQSKIVLTVDQAATAAMTRLKVYWNEQIEYAFATSLMYTRLTVTDVIEVEDYKGVWHRMRLEDRNEDGGIIEWDAVQDAGDLTYVTQRVGNALPPPVSTTPGIISLTRIEIVNSSPLRDQDDKLGVYVAAAGKGSAWTGYQMLYSFDGGVSYAEAYRATAPSTIGEIDSDLLEETDPEYQGGQTVVVEVNLPLSSISYDQLLKGLNRICIGDEILQFQTASLIGMNGANYRYELSGLVRAKYNTSALHWPVGTRFVLLDETVIFVEAQRSMIGQDLTYKPVSNGHTEDESIPTDYLYDEPLSQIEWPVAWIEVDRDGSDNVTVDWVGRARLGLDTTPYHSTYFRGYRVKFSDGHTIDTTSETATYSSAPVGVTVQVCALNEITGEGPYSDPIAT